MTRDLEKTLESDESLAALLKAAAQSPEFRAASGKAEQGPHVPEEILLEYMRDKGGLTDEETAAVMDHIALCSKCARKLFSLRREASKKVAEPWWEALEQSLNSDEQLQVFLKDVLGASSGPQEMANDVATLHLSAEEVDVYLQDTLTNERMAALMDHMAECGLCSRRVFAARAAEEGARVIHADFPHGKSLIQALRELLEPKLATAASLALAFEMIGFELSQTLFAPPVIHMMGPPDEEEALRVSGSLVDSGQCVVGETVALEITAQRDGFLWVFDQWLEEQDGHLRWVFPCCTEHDASMKSGHTRQIGMPISGPPGRHLLLAVWTANELVDSKQIELNDRIDVERTITVFLLMLKKLSLEDWDVQRYEFLVRDA